MTVFLGIDPGKSGGFAITHDGHPGAGRAAWPMPATERDCYGPLTGYAAKGCFAFIEKVHSSPQMGVKSAFTFGQSYGFLRGCLIALGIPFETVSPRAWQKGLGIVYPKGATDTQKKNITKAKAQELFPGLRITHAVADALLIAEYARRTFGEKP